MRLSNRQLGALTVLAIVSAGLWVAGQMVWKSRQATNRVTVLFPDMGSLQPQDPVTSRGFPVGTVGSVAWIDGMAKVELHLDEPMLLREGTEIRNENYSLMGQRRIEILPKHDGPIVSPDYVFEGTFESGIAEAMHLMAKVKEQVISIRDLVFLLGKGDSATPSIPQITEMALVQSETVISLLERTMKVARPALLQGLAQTEQMGYQAIDLTKQADTTIRLVHTKGTMTIAETKAMLARVQSTLQDLILFLEEFEAKPIAQQLLQKQEVIAKAASLVESLQSVLKLFDKNGLVILDENGKPRGLSDISNINLLGKTARQKARIQLEQPTSESSR